MKAFIIFLIVTCLFSCSGDKDDVTLSSVDKMVGFWKWESTCGGLIDHCGYSSNSHYGVIQFTSEFKLIETHNDTVFLKADYQIKKANDFSGVLILKNIVSKSIVSDSIRRPISIVNNKMVIIRGELIDTYKK